MRALSFLSCAVLVILASGTAHAISRVGTCLVDPNQGFRVDAPKPYLQFNELAGDGMRIASVTLPRVFGFPSAPMTEDIDFHPLPAVYPELRGVNRDSVQTLLASKGAEWTPKPTTDSCALALSSKNGHVRTTIVTWGAGKGFALTSPVTASAEAAIESVLAKLQLDPGACSW